MDIVMNRKTDWGVIFDLFHKNRLSVDRLLMGAGFFPDRPGMLQPEISEHCVF